MTNPLLQKYEELYGKKEKPKVIKAENAKVEIKGTQIGYTYTDEISVATSNTSITKASPIKSYDKYSGNDAFLELAEKVKNGTAQVKCVSLEVDAHGIFGYGKRITFEVYDYEP